MRLRVWGKGQRGVDFDFDFEFEFSIPIIIFSISSDKSGMLEKALVKKEIT